LLAGELRPPEVKAAEHAEHHRAEQHVVEVRNHEVGVAHGEVQRRGGEEDTGEPAQQERDKETDGEKNGAPQRSWPRHIVPIQLKNFTPVGTAIKNVMSEKNGSSIAPVVNMWCAHTVIDSPAMPIVAATMPLYPNSGLRLNTGRISVAMPKNGIAPVDHPGWPKNQNRGCHKSP